MRVHMQGRFYALFSISNFTETLYFKHAFWVSAVNGFAWDLAEIQPRVFKREGYHSLSNFKLILKSWNLINADGRI